MLNKMIKALLKKKPRTMCDECECEWSTHSIGFHCYWSGKHEPQEIIYCKHTTKVCVIRTQKAHFCHMRVLLFLCVRIYPVNIKVHCALKPICINEYVVYSCVFTLCTPFNCNYIWYLNCHMKDIYHSSKSISFSSFKNRLQLHELFLWIFFWVWACFVQIHHIYIFFCTIFFFFLNVYCLYFFQINLIFLLQFNSTFNTRNE